MEFPIAHVRRRLQVAICIASLLVIARECHFDGDDMTESGRDIGGGLVMRSDGQVLDSESIAAATQRTHIAEAAQRRGR